MKASACHHTPNANHQHCLQEIPPLIGVKNNIVTIE